MNRFSVIESVEHLIHQYRSFIKSSYRLADEQLRRQFEAHVEGAEVLVKGPYVTLSREFADGCRLSELVAEGVIPPALERLNWPFRSRPLFAHQEDALRAVAQGRNVIVKTGTGSGKTESFLLPVLSGILRMKEEGISGTKAILLYPMNALANDQLVRIRDIFRGTNAKVTFALYTGESETVASTLGEPLDGHELTRKTDIRSNPPDIILTNYKQLEFLLVRKADRALFTPALRYVVLDEIHSYRGALATELACLLRRLKARAEVSPGAIRVLGTSATVSQDAGGDQALARFATDIFGEPFEGPDIIGERYQEPAAAATYEPPAVGVTESDIHYFTQTDEIGLVGFAERLTGRKAPDNGSVHEKITALLVGNRVVDALRAETLVPKTLNEIAAAIRDRVPSLQALDVGALCRLLQAYLLVGSYGDDGEPPVLRPKMHTFFHGVYDVGLCMNPQCRHLATGAFESCPKCGSAVRPAVLCRTCGQDFVKVTLQGENGAELAPNDDFSSSDDTAFITPRLIGEHDDDEEEQDDSSDGPARSRGGRRQTAAQRRVEEKWVDHVRGLVFEKEPSDIPRENLSLQQLYVGRGSSCPVCNGRSARGDILTLLRTGVASSVSVLGTHHLDKLPENDRKLLIFADNRQDAAHQAGYMSDRHRLFALRHAIDTVVRNSGGSSLQGIEHHLLETFQDVGLAIRRLVPDQRRQWHRVLLYEAVGEFCRTSHQRTSLENLGLVEVDYEFLDELAADSRFTELCRRANLSVDRGRALVRAMLDYMRRRRAVAFDFYQSYLDPKKSQWSQLTVAPYNLAVPERERNAVFFVNQRPEAFRGQGVAGIRLEPFTKDSERGARGGISKLICDKAGLSPSVGEDWILKVVDLLEKKEVLERVPHLPERARTQLGGAKPLQIAARIIKLRPGKQGWRCRKCSIWRPYNAGVCLATTSCSGRDEDLVPTEVDPENYYVRLYQDERPRRMRVLEHTAQIDQEERAKREQDFKDGRVDTLVCSPTLELGVNIGTLFGVLMRNAPHAPANYVQRAGRAGRRLRIGYASTFCGTSPHDRHCFENPAWLVRGEFTPPVVRLSNDRIVARHVRSLALEELNEEFSWLMGDLLANRQNPEVLNPELFENVVRQIQVRGDQIGRKADVIFGWSGAADIVRLFPAELDTVVRDWHEQVKRLHKEFQEYALIVATRETEQKRRARMRAYQELTTDREKAFVLSYFSDQGLLPSYQFPTDTFSLDPGVGDTPTLRRPAWIALFEFAPGNMVYANGHKLKSIRAIFEGHRRNAGGSRASEQSGRVESYCFCDNCGFTSAGIVNTCPTCGHPIRKQADVAIIDAFEAEENTQITSAEDSRQREMFERRENLLTDSQQTAKLFPYEFTTLEFRQHAHLLVTNWGKVSRADTRGQRFELCSLCGKYVPHGLTEAKRRAWDENHRKFCTGDPRIYVLGYEFKADVLTVPLSARVVPNGEQEARVFCRTLGKSLVIGAQELLEIEPDEIAYFHQSDGNGGITLVFYETAAGGAGYLERLAQQLNGWAKAAQDRLYKHDCEKSCYKCLRSARNQADHGVLDKQSVRSVLFNLAQADKAGESRTGSAGDGGRLVNQWFESDAAATPTSDTPIERALLDAIRTGGRLPEPMPQFEIHDRSGGLITVPDFAYVNERIAIYCDGFAYHGNRDTLESDSRKRNALQTLGWKVLVFWGRQIVRNPSACEAQIWQCYREGLT